MPFYEYECVSCKFYVEQLQKISDPPLVQCPSCGKETMQRLVSAPNFRLKGSGWYETDFKSDQENKRNIAGGDESVAAPEKTAESGDAKSEVRVTKRRAAIKKNGAQSAKSASKPAAKKAAKKLARKAVKKAATKVAKKAAKKVVKKAGKKAVKKHKKVAAKKVPAKKPAAKKSAGKKKSAASKSVKRKK